MNFSYRLKINFIIIIITISVYTISRGNTIEFNTDILDLEDKKHIDFTGFSNPGYILPGEYQLQIKVNGQNIGNGEIPIVFYPELLNEKYNKKIAETRACLPISLGGRLGLTEEAKKNIVLSHSENCLDFSKSLGVTINPNINNAYLNIVIPQKWLEYRDDSWLPPSLWDNGISGLLFDYNIYANYTQNSTHQYSQNVNSNGTVGVNFGAWRLRGDYQGSYLEYNRKNSSGNHSSFDFERVYLYKPIPQWAAKLTLGESYITSSIFDSWRYTGITLESDENMLPPHLRGYAPEIIGVAKTNARVTIYNLGRIVYNSSVPAGPFRIQDLDSNIRGQLDVKVTEENGDIQTFSVSTATVPYLTRPGQIRYQTTIGRPRIRKQLEGPMFATSSITWGVSNAWSLYGGSILSDDYQAIAIGVGRDLFQLGTFSLDVTQSKADLPKEGSLEGKSWHFSYSKLFDEAKANITFAGYRYSEKEFMSMQQYLDNLDNSDTRYLNNNLRRQKERYQFNMSKNFDSYTASVNYGYQTYWDREDTYQYGISLGTNFDLPLLNLRNTSMNLTANRSHYKETLNSGASFIDNTVNLSISIPVSNGSVNLNSNYGSGSYNHRVNYSGRNDLDSYNLGVQLNTGAGSGTSSQTSFSGMYTRNSPWAMATVNSFISSDNNRSIGGSITGGITATSKGIAVHSGGHNGSSRLMINTNGVAGVPINNGKTITNSWGIGVIPNITDYYRSTNYVDVNKLSDDIEVPNGVVDVALTEGAIGYRTLVAFKGEKLFAVLRLIDNTYPPFGASVKNGFGYELGLVGENGLTWLSGVNHGEELKVIWDGKEQCRVYIPEQLKVKKSLLLPCN